MLYIFSAAGMSAQMLMAVCWSPNPNSDTLTEYALRRSFASLSLLILLDEEDVLCEPLALLSYDGKPSRVEN